MTGPQNRPPARHAALHRRPLLRRLGLGRLSSLDRSRRSCAISASAGELVPIDTKKLGRIDCIGHRITGYRVGVNRNPGIGYEVAACLRR